MRDGSTYDNTFGIDMKPIDDNEKLYEKYMSVSSFDDLFKNKEKVVHNEILFSKDIGPKPIDSTETMPILYVPVPQEEKRDMEDFVELKEYLNSSFKSSIKAKVYEWIKGIVIISRDGKIIKKSLDNTNEDYALYTKELINKINDVNINSKSLFKVGTIGSDNGIIVFQSNKENGIIYLPLEITKEQFDELQCVIIPRGGFNYSFVHNETVYENVGANELLNYANNIVIIKKKRKMF